jgi:hypothetical protein
VPFCRTDESFRRGARCSLRRVSAVLAYAVAMGACNEPMIAPDGSSIDLSIGASTIAAGGEPTTVSVLVAEQDGVLVRDGTRVTFVLSGGEVCTDSAAPSHTGCTWSNIATAETKVGVATAYVRGREAGTITLQVRSGSITTSKNITVSGLVAPANAKVVIQATPDSLAVGASSAIRAFVSTAEGAPVANGTRVVFTATNGTIDRPIVLTQDGFADARFLASTAGTAEVKLVSGPASGLTSITVRATP